MGQRPLEINRKMGLKGKIITSILIVGALPLILGLYLNYLGGRKALTSSIGSNFQEIAKGTADKLDIILKKEVMEAWNLAVSPRITEAVEASNLIYNGKSDEEIRKELGTLSRRWTMAGDDDPLLNTILGNDVSIYFKTLKGYEEEKYEAILVTNRRGVLVASTNREYDYYQADQRWWRSVYNKGGGNLFLGDIYFDKRGDRYLIEIGVPVYRKGSHHVIGAIKMVYKADQTFKVIADVKIDKTGHANLVSADGMIIICPIFPPKSHSIGKELIERIISQSNGWGIAEDDGHGGKNSIIGFAPVRFIQEIGEKSFGGRPWYILVRQHPDETYAPIYSLLFKVSLSGFLLVGVLALMGFYAANKIVGPIILLQEEAGLIGKGDLEHRLDIKTGDEIESLAEEFNRMTVRLKQSRDQLRTERDKLELILLSAGEGIVVADDEKKVIMLNPMAEKILGVSREDIEGKSIFPCHKNPDNVAEILNRGDSGPISLTTSIETKTVEIIVSAIRSGDKIVGSMMLLRDITLMKQMEEELKHYSERLAVMIEERTMEIEETRDYLQSLLENANDIICTIDLSGNFTYINQKIEEWGYKKEDLIGTSFASLLAGKEEVEKIYPSMKDGVKETFEVKILNKKGEARDTVISTSPLRNNKGITIGLLGIARDITEQKGLIQQVLRSEKMAAIGQLSMGIAHEINNPLSGMLNCVKALSEEGDNESLRKRYHNLLGKGLLKIEAIMKQLLSFAKEHQFEFSPHRLDDLISDTLKLVEYKIKEGDIQLQLNLNCKRKTYLFPANHLQQVFLNIIINAIQAMSKGGTLTIKSKEVKKDLEVTISDTGIGISEENLNRIFDPFFTTKDVGTGTGLGLSVSYGIIEKLGGRIEVESKVGKGSSFKVIIPKRNNQ